MRIKRFNENKEEGEKYNVRHITQNDEIWASKKDLQFMFRGLLNGVKEIDASNSSDIDKKIKEGFIYVFGNLKNFMDDIGGNPRKAYDPYGEEEWEE